MNVIAKRTLREFWQKHPHAKKPLSAWHTIVSKANWTTPAEIKAAFGTNVDFVKDNRVIFDIGGNKYRVILHVSYQYKSALIKFVGTHDEYDAIDPETV
ncbi:MAG: type II toxin-antitoxin system HigB family toxin [Pseudolabrys sp.]